MGRSAWTLILTLVFILTGFPAFGQTYEDRRPGREERAVRSQTLNLPGFTIHRYQTQGGEIQTRSYHYAPNSRGYHRGYNRGRRERPRCYRGYPGHGGGPGVNLNTRTR